MLTTLLLPRGMWAGIAVSAVLGLLYLAVGGLTPLPLNRAVLLGLAVGLAWCGGYVGLIYRPALDYAGRTGQITVRADDYATGYGAYGVFKGTILSIDGQKINRKAKIYLQDGSPEDFPGNILTFSGKVSAAPAETRRGNLQNGIFLTVSQQGEVVSREDKPTLLNRAAILSGQLKARIFEMLEGDEAALLAALLTGEKGEFSQELRRALTVSGSSHITAVSGLHISILVALLVGLFGKRAGLYAAVPAMVFYAAVAGFSPSVVRAVIMCGFTVAAFALRREWDTPTALFSALFLLVAWNPFSILSPGLALSFGAALGIVAFSPMLNDFFGRCRPKRLRKLYDSVTGSVAASLAAMSLTMPLCILLFDSVSLVSVLTTLLVLWAVSFSMALGLALLLVSVYLPAVAAFLARYVLYWPLTWMVRVILWIGGQTWASLSSGNLYLAVAAVTLLAVMLAALGKKLRGVASAALAILAFCACFGLTAMERRLYADIAVYGGSGGAVILLRTGGEAVAVGTGGDPWFVDDTLLEWGVSGLESLILTGNDAYTLYTAAALTRRVSAQRILAPEGAGLFSGDSPEVLWYNSNGSLAFGPFTITLFAGGEGWLSRITGPGISILDLTGLHPMDALGAVEGEADILILDDRWRNAPHTMDKVCQILRPRLIYYCDSGFGSSLTHPSVPVLLSSEAGVLTVHTY